MSTKTIIDCKIGLAIDAQGTEAGYPEYQRQPVEFGCPGTDGDDLTYWNMKSVRFPSNPHAPMLVTGLLVFSPDGFVYFGQIERGLALKPLDTAMVAPEGVQFSVQQKPIRREHMAASTCWCEPTLDSVNAETGAAIWVHRGAQ